MFRFPNAACTCACVYVFQDGQVAQGLLVNVTLTCTVSNMQIISIRNRVFRKVQKHHVRDVIIHCLKMLRRYRNQCKWPKWQWKQSITISPAGKGQVLTYERCPAYFWTDLSSAVKLNQDISYCNKFYKCEARWVDISQHTPENEK